jgi:hypothetical protein
MGGFLYTPVMMEILRVADATRPPFDRSGNQYIVTVTSGCDYVEGRKINSKHPDCMAWDIRVNDLPNPDRDGREWVRRMRLFLPKHDYDVLFRGKKSKKGDNRHIHAEYDPDIYKRSKS